MYLLFQLMSKTQLLIIYSRGPQSPGHGMVEVQGLLAARLHSRGWAAGKWEKLHRYLESLPITCITAWALPSVKSGTALDFHRGTSVNCTWQGSRLSVPHENPTPDDLRWSWGGDASAGGRLPCLPLSPDGTVYLQQNKLRAPTDSALWWVVLIISLYVTV